MMNKWSWQICSFIGLICLLNLSTVKAEDKAKTTSRGNKGKDIRLFIIGNSFSQNATRFLNKLVVEAGHRLTIGRAELSGCSLQRHWELADSSINNPEKGRAYKGKSLIQKLREDNWDVISIQQASILSSTSTSYKPFAQNLTKLIKKSNPQSEVVIHKTWAYRSDASYFGKINNTLSAKSDKEMYDSLSTAYAAIASDLGLRVIPTGDAFWQITSSPEWTFQKDNKFDEKTAVYPELPSENNSLHAGYSWIQNNGRNKLKFDTHHASNAGCFLGSLVWYAFLFDENPEKLSYVPDGVDPQFAAELKKTAWQVVKFNKNRK